MQSIYHTMNLPLIDHLNAFKWPWLVIDCDKVGAKDKQNVKIEQEIATFPSIMSHSFLFKSVNSYKPETICSIQSTISVLNCFKYIIYKKYKNIFICSSSFLSATSGFILWNGWRQTNLGFKFQCFLNVDKLLSATHFSHPLITLFNNLGSTQISTISP